MKRWRRAPPAAAPLLVVAAAVLLFAGCTTVAPLAPAAPGADYFAGRLSLRVDASEREPARAFSAAFDLRGSPDAGALALSTPLGSMLARADWSPGAVVLVTPRGTSRFANLDRLTHEALGESVPIEAWFDWLRGRPWSGAPSAPSPDGPGFEQLGWRVDTERFVDGAVSATRLQPPPRVTIRILLDPA